ncbi:hypothetical protein V6R21_05875, partial [Limibacter armeniacum]
HIRCGILHQGETTGGWMINRDPKKELLEAKTINATKFADELDKKLNSYKEELEKSDWDSEVWDNFRTKMRAVIKNCQSQN